MIESNRVKKLRLWVINTIPKFPNDKNTKQLLEAKSLSGLFIDSTFAVERFAATALNSARLFGFQGRK
jgi:hypothetical protein